jgi:hypothetical protein
MKPLLTLLFLLAAAVAWPESTPGPDAQEKFISGGTIRMHLEGGAYTIRPSDVDTITVSCKGSDERLRHVKTKIKIAGSRADVSVTDTPHNNFTAMIEVPRRSDLWIRLSAGDLHVEPVVGSKDLELHAGELTVDVPHPQEYGHRDAGVWTGSVDASAFEVSKGGLFRSFEQDGPGQYKLHAHVLAGEINFRVGQ